MDLQLLRARKRQIQYIIQGILRLNAAGQTGDRQNTVIATLSYTGRRSIGLPNNLLESLHESQTIH